MTNASDMPPLSLYTPWCISTSLFFGALFPKLILPFLPLTTLIAPKTKVTAHASHESALIAVLARATSHTWVFHVSEGSMHSVVPKKKKENVYKNDKLTMPKHILPLKNTANATNPLNQNNIVKPSSPSSAHFTLALSLKLSNFGTSWRRSKGTRERRDHEGAKMR
jgi:hypothetical protein